MYYLIKFENKKLEEKSTRDKLNDKYAELLEKKRVYYKTLKEFQEVIFKLALVT